MLCIGVEQAFTLLERRDYMNKDLGHTVITDKIRVSSAAIKSFSPHTGEYYQYETFIFSDDERQKTRQVIHGTSDNNNDEYLTALTKKIHRRIADNLKENYGEEGGHEV